MLNLILATLSAKTRRYSAFGGFFLEKFKHDLQPTPQYFARCDALDAAVATDGKY